MGRTRRQLLAVMFTDIAGYSAMVNRDERRAQQLLHQHRELVRREVARREGRVIETIGDGFLVTFDNARAALECAVVLQRELLRRNAGAAADDQLRLRIGIHAGDIEHDGRKVFGDGVNVAARLEPLAPRGGIAASAQAVAQLHGPLRACFVSQGPRELKNIAEPHEVFALADDAVEAAAAHVPAPSTIRLALRRLRPALAASLAIVVVASGWLLYRSDGFVVADGASIAVLPLENLSGDKDSADFVAGLHDSLLTEISTVPAIKVISRTSVMRYAHNAPPVPEIARALNVNYILEGSVQRTARRVRINVQLIRARSDQHIWARTYDRDAADLFDTQAQIAREVARSTQGRVVMDAAPASQRPTTSVDAYDLYLRAIALEDNDPKLGREPPTAQIALLEQAVALDPKFALAHAALARYDVWGANWGSYMDPVRATSYLAAADRSAATAMTLAPQLPESKVAAGLVAYWEHKDPRAVARYLEEALAARPAYPLALFWLGSVYDRMGDIERSTATLKALNAIDPYNERVYTLIVQHQLNARAYTDLAQTYDAWRSVSATPGFVDFWSAQLHFYRSGDLEPWKALSEPPLKDGITAEDADKARWEIAMYEKRFADAANICRPRANEFAKGRSGDYSWASWAGLALTAAGERAAAQPFLSAAAAYLRKAMVDAPDDGELRAEFAQIEAALGEESAALKDAGEAVRLTTPAAGSRPKYGHYESVRLYAQVLARFGHAQEALAQLDWLLREPSDVHANAVLRDPLWAPLNEAPAFRQLVSKYVPAGA